MSKFIIFLFILPFTTATLVDKRYKRLVEHCFDKTPNQTIIWFAPLTEYWDISKHDCLASCIDHIGNMNEKCRIALYGSGYKSCYLYRERLKVVNTKQKHNPHFDMYVRSHDFGAVGNCSSPSFFTLPAFCPDGRKTGFYQYAFHMALAPDHFRDVIATFSNVDQQECSRYCDRNIGPDLEKLTCASYNYNTSSRVCVMHSFRAAPNGRGHLGVDVNMVYGEKYCIPFGSPATCLQNDLYFRSFTESTLSDTPFRIIKAATLGRCLTACINQPGCMASSYSLDPKKCYLFRNSLKVDHSNQKTETGSVLVENSCTISSGAICDANQSPAYYLRHGARIAFNESISTTHRFVPLAKITEPQCAQYCSENKRPDDKDVQCAGFNFNHNKNQCFLHKHKGQPHGPGQFVSDFNYDNYEKFCLYSDVPAACKSQRNLLFPVHPMEFIKGHHIASVHAVDLDECVHFCTSASVALHPLGSSHQCKSVVFDRNITRGFDNCHLKSIHKSEADGYTLKKAYKDVVLVENGCNLDQSQLVTTNPTSGTASSSSSGTAGNGKVPRIAGENALTIFKDHFEQFKSPVKIKEKNADLVKKLDPRLLYLYRLTGTTTTTTNPEVDQLKFAQKVLRLLKEVIALRKNS